MGEDSRLKNRIKEMEDGKNCCSCAWPDFVDFIKTSVCEKCSTNYCVDYSRWVLELPPRESSEAMPDYEERVYKRTTLKRIEHQHGGAE